MRLNSTPSATRRFDRPFVATCIAVAVSVVARRSPAAEHHGRKHPAARPRPPSTAVDHDATAPAGAAQHDTTAPGAAQHDTTAPAGADSSPSAAADGHDGAPSSHGGNPVDGHGRPPVSEGGHDGVAAVPASADASTAAGRRPTGVVSRALVDAEIAGDAAGRSFDYHDGLSGNLRSYSVAPAAMFGGHVAVFPLADGLGLLRDIGVVGAYARSLFLESALSGGIHVHTVESAYSVGLRVRIHPWGEEAALIGVSDEYAGQSFVFDPVGGGVDSQLPAADYRANRTAVDGRIPFGRLALLASFGFRAVFDAGPVASRFRHPSANGIDADLGAAFAIARGIEARAVLDYERYFYSFSPVPGDAYVAGGALDQFYGARLGLAYVY